MHRLTCLILTTLLIAIPQMAAAQGPYPNGNASAQPDQRFAFPSPPAGANDQTFRLIVRPGLWGGQARLRLTNSRFAITEPD